MAKFLFLYRKDEAGADWTKQSPEEMQQVLQLWMDWIGGGMQAGWMVDGGHALLPEGRVVKSDQAVTDGPFAESKELVGGFSIVQAADLDAAVALTKGCPSLSNGGLVEVRPLWEHETPDA